MEIYIDECLWASMSTRDHRWVYTSIRSQICEFLTERLSRGHHITTTSFNPSYNLNINDLASCIVIYTNTLRLWSRDIRERGRERESAPRHLYRTFVTSQDSIEHNLNVNFFEREREKESVHPVHLTISRTLVTSQDPTEHPNVNFFEGERERASTARISPSLSHVCDVTRPYRASDCKFLWERERTHLGISLARSWRHRTLPSIWM